MTLSPSHPTMNICNMHVVNVNEYFRICVIRPENITKNPTTQITMELDTKLNRIVTANILSKSRLILLMLIRR